MKRITVKNKQTKQWHLLTLTQSFFTASSDFRWLLFYFIYLLFVCVCVLCLSAVSSHSMSYVDHRFFSPFILKNNDELFVLYTRLEFSLSLPSPPAPFLSPTTSFSRTPKSYPTASWQGGWRHSWLYPYNGHSSRRLSCTLCAGHVAVLTFTAFTD